MIKTIQLTGTEQSVDGLSGYNTIIVNRGSETVYASAKPGIAAGADGVIAIDAGSREELPDTNGTVYLLGSGEVNLRGTEGSVNFRVPSSGTAGGSTPADDDGENDIMPITDGLSGYFDAEKGASETGWMNLIDGTSMDFKGGKAIVYNSEITLLNGVYAIFHLPYTDGDFTVYAVLRADYDSTRQRHDDLIGSAFGNTTCSWRTITSDGYSADGDFRTFMVNMYGDGIGGSVSGMRVRTYDSYHAVTISQRNGRIYMYIDGVKVDDDKAVSNRFGNYWALNGIASDDGKLSVINSVVLHIRLWALGSTAHTPEQILQNQRFLMKKFT